MGEAERRSITELLVRYEYEPELRDIYVEGSEDKAVLEGIFEENGITGISIFEISSVNIPNDTGTENNNRTRTIKLSKILSETPETSKAIVACVIDSDFDCFGEKTETNNNLFKTDYANLEMYFFTKDIIVKINRRVLSKNKIINETHYKFIISTLLELYKIRYINSKPKWQLKYLAFDKLLQFTKGKFKFDCGEYISRYLSKNSRITELSNFVEEVNIVITSEKQDCRCFIHGHDCLVLLGIVLNCLSGKNIFVCQESVFSLLKASSEYKQIIDEPMFIAILKRFDLCKAEFQAHHT